MLLMVTQGSTFLYRQVIELALSSNSSFYPKFRVTSAFTMPFNN